MYKLMGWLLRRDAQAVKKALNPTKEVKIEGIIFQIRKINPIDYLAGFKIMNQMYETYKIEGKEKSAELVSASKIRDHYVDIFTAAVINPKIVRKLKDGQNDALLVDALFNNWEICEKLYAAIIEFTYGKKKLRQLASQKKSWWN